MTERTVVECDWHDCDETERHDTNGLVPPDWGVLTSESGTDYHFCPRDAKQAARWCLDGISEGEALVVRHSYIGHAFEEAHATGDTLGMYVTPVVDEPPSKFPEYDPALGADGQETEAYGFHVYDHLHVYVIGGHKGEPHVVVDSDEFPTTLEVWDTEDSFDRVDLGEGVSFNA